jgi:hypothetical protein
MLLMKGRLTVRISRIAVDCSCEVAYMVNVPVIRVQDCATGWVVSVLKMKLPRDPRAGGEGSLKEAARLRQWRHPSL